MKTSRRKFIKNGTWAAIGALFVPSLFDNDNLSAAPYSLNYKPDPGNWSDDEISIAWLGHSTILINIYGKIILTDPALMERVGVYLFGASIGPSRLTPPALFVEDLPKPDLILLSHGHMDHTDYPTLKAITERFPNQIDVVVAYLTQDIVEDLAWKSLTILDWGDITELGGIKIKAYEVEHFGWRFPWEKDRSRGYMKDGRSYNAYLIEYEGKKILFGGDTRNSEKLRILKDENVDIALMPIGAYNPWKQSHCNPEEALQMADEFGAKYFIPMHCKTFAQGREPFEEPINWLKKSGSNYKVKIALEEIGQTFILI
jgi:L-ascorbate metabolism protein UlaG (beta-lactamase superfamily)